MKLMIWLGITVVGGLFGWLGTIIDHGNFLGIWSLLLSTVGSLLGVWVGYKLYKNFF
jgi:uncharacterized membrane protein YeaQ/YmgE (transglycosylase-associated protein family)